MSTLFTGETIKDETGKRIARAIEDIAAGIDRKKKICYGFHIDSSESDPEACVTYVEDSRGYTPAGNTYDS